MKYLRIADMASRMVYRGGQYTEAEIESALAELGNMLESAEDERREANRKIRAIRKNIDYYKNLDKRQLKIGWND